MNYEKTLRCIQKYQPDTVVHLAAQSSVGYSWDNPVSSFNNNVNIFLNLIESIRISNIDCRILSVGSSESYGIVDKSILPLKESDALNPISPYAVARVSQEMLSKVYVEGYGMDILMTRSFNHFGPGQDERFVIPSFIKRILNRKKYNSNEVIEVGDLSIIRDFVDVRDVVKAYVLLLEYGATGKIYNICSGEGRSLKEILINIQLILNYNVGYRVNPSFIRPNDNPIIIGDYSKIKQKVGWSPEINLDKSLQDIVTYIEKTS